MIMIVQYLCENRHAIIAAGPYDSEKCSASEMEASLREVLKENPVNLHCGICGSTKLHFEHEKSREQDFAAALKAMFGCALEQAVTRRLLDDSGQSYDVKKAREAREN